MTSSFSTPPPGWGKYSPPPGEPQAPAGMKSADSVTKRPAERATRPTANSGIVVARPARKRPTAPSMYCPHCGVTGMPRKVTKGSFGIELILWLFFLLPGLIYSVWRRNSYGASRPSFVGRRPTPAHKCR